MDAINLLETDHRTVDELFSRAENEGPSRQREIFVNIKGELDAHAHIEEVIFYPELLARGDKELQDIVREGIEEHSQIKKFLGELAATGTDGDTFSAKLKVLIEDTRHHVKEEEDEMFDMVRDQLSAEQIEKLGDRMQAEKEKFQKAHGIKPVPPKPGILQAAADGVAGLIDRVVGGAPVPKKSGKSKAGKTGGPGKKAASGSKVKARSVKSSSSGSSATRSKSTGVKASGSSSGAKKASATKSAGGSAKSTPASSSKGAAASKRKSAAKSSSAKASGAKSSGGSKPGGSRENCGHAVEFGLEISQCKVFESQSRFI
ncbi:MAG: hemerythrin domain-containing protein [Blastocatellia bacterium]|nr:hemerythrin domain-containing protein [Blastocatellia bacterium]